VDERLVAIKAQADHAWEQNELRGRLLRRVVDTHPLPEHIPIAYDDWLVDDRLAYFAVFAVYTFECRREGRLYRGEGPFYCGRCEEPQEGWRQLRCWECAWPKIRAYAGELATHWHEMKGVA